MSDLPIFAIKKNGRRTHGPTNGRTDRPSYIDAWTHLKILPTWLPQVGIYMLSRLETEKSRNNGFQGISYSAGAKECWMIKPLLWNICFFEICYSESTVRHDRSDIVSSLYFSFVISDIINSKHIFLVPSVRRFFPSTDISYLVI